MRCWVGTIVDCSPLLAWDTTAEGSPGVGTTTVVRSPVVDIPEVGTIVCHSRIRHHTERDTMMLEQRGRVDWGSQCYRRVAGSLSKERESVNDANRQIGKHCFFGQR